MNFCRRNSTSWTQRIRNFRGKSHTHLEKCSLSAVCGAYEVVKCLLETGSRMLFLAALKSREGTELPKTSPGWYEVARQIHILVLRLE